MGWTTTYLDKSRKEFMDGVYTSRETETSAEHKVLKSSMVGGVYYAAVQMSKNGNILKVYAAVAITKLSGNEISYKDMDETCCPSYYDCPKTILNMLSDTDNESAIEWRNRVKDKLRLKKLDKLPEGSAIKFILRRDLTSGFKKGDEVILHKYKNGKRCIWTDGGYKWSKEYISADFEIIQEGSMYGYIRK